LKLGPGLLASSRRPQPSLCHFLNMFSGDDETSMLIPGGSASRKRKPEFQVHAPPKTTRVREDRYPAVPDVVYDYGSYTGAPYRRYVRHEHELLRERSRAKALRLLRAPKKKKKRPHSVGAKGKVIMIKL